VTRSGEHDEFGPAHRGLYRLADRDGSAYVVVVAQQERRYVYLGQYVALSSTLARAMARKPPGRNSRTLSTNLATRSVSAEGENIDGTLHPGPAAPPSPS
jgi:hypothetical protein